MRKLLVAAALVVAVVVGTAVAAHFWLVDGLAGWLWNLTMDEDTVYAPGYSDAGFRRVRGGMSVEQVHALLGPPLQKWPLPFSTDPSEVGERWSRSPGDTNYRCRVVLFRHGHVVRKHAEFYVD